MFFWVKLLYLDKTGSNRVKVVVFGQKWFYSKKCGCIRAKWSFSDQLVVFRQK